MNTQKKIPNGEFSPGYQLTHGLPEPRDLPTISINISDHPFLDSPPFVFHMNLPPQGASLGITIKQCQYHNLPYIVSSSHRSLYQQAVPHQFRHNIWIIAIDNKNHITVDQVKKNLISHQHPTEISDPIKMVVAKRISNPPPTLLQNHWATFNQIRIIPHHIYNPINDSITTVDNDNPPDEGSITETTKPPPTPPSVITPTLLQTQTAVSAPTAIPNTSSTSIDKFSPPKI